MELHEKIKTMRELKQWSQESMAEKLGMSVTGYAKIEQGKTRLSVDRLEKIAEIFDLNILELLSKDKPLFLLVGDNSQNFGSNYYGSNEALILENEKLKLMLNYEKNLVEQKDNEINALKEIIQLLKQNSVE